MAYMPREPVTPRGVEYTRTDNLPQSGSTSPYKGDQEGNMRLVKGSLGEEAGKDTVQLGGIGMVSGGCGDSLCCCVCRAGNSPRAVPASRLSLPPLPPFTP
jgi:hypothetical protein